MKQKVIFILVFVLLVAALIGLNAASLKQKPKTPDNEFAPNRSTYNSGATGTQAFYALLSETGRKVIRWQENPDRLSHNPKQKIGTFVVIGPVRREFDDAETSKLLEWVVDGGKLIIIDRQPPKAFLSTTSFWTLNVKPDYAGLYVADPTDPATMTKDIAAVKPVHPSLLTAAVGSVQPSTFASDIGFDRNKTAPDSYNEDFAAPVVHVRSGEKNIVVDVPYGSGRIVFLSDPFMVSNGGIGLVDNAQLAIDLVNPGDASIAFDEFHQGFGSNDNRLAKYFAGTPVIAIFLQCAAFIALVFYSQSRRFARPVPEPEPDRLSKLEYVGAMAELQQRTRAYDLAVENIYREFRRRAARSFGVDNRSTSRSDLSRLIAERTQLKEAEIDHTLYKAEEIMHGDPTNKSEVTAVIAEIRAMEDALGLRRRTAK